MDLGLNLVKIGGACGKNNNYLVMVRELPQDNGHAYKKPTSLLVGKWKCTIASSVLVILPTIQGCVEIFRGPGVQG